MDQLDAYIRQAQENIRAAKANRATAKANGNYKKSARFRRANGQEGTSYDAAVWRYEDRLAELKKQRSQRKGSSSRSKSSKKSSKSYSSSSFSLFGLIGKLFKFIFKAVLFIIKFAFWPLWLLKKLFR